MTMTWKAGDRVQLVTEYMEGEVNPGRIISRDGVLCYMGDVYQSESDAIPLDGWYGVHDLLPEGECPWCGHREVV